MMQSSTSSAVMLPLATELAANRHCGAGMVAGDHFHANPGSVCLKSMMMTFRAMAMIAVAITIRT